MLWLGSSIHSMGHDDPQFRPHVSPQRPFLLFQFLVHDFMGIGVSISNLSVRHEITIMFIKPF